MNQPAIQAQYLLSLKKFITKKLLLQSDFASNDRNSIDLFNVQGPCFCCRD